MDCQRIDSGAARVGVGVGRPTLLAPSPPYSDADQALTCSETELYLTEIHKSLPGVSRSLPPGPSHRRSHPSLSLPDVLGTSGSLPNLPSSPLRLATQLQTIFPQSGVGVKHIKVPT